MFFCFGGGGGCLVLWFFWWGWSPPQTAPPQVDLQGAAVVAAAATAANLFESWLGATAQGRVEWLNNDIVNAIQIAVAAGLAVAATAALGGGA